MIRNIDMNEVSDGKRYVSDSLVKIACNDCKGCSKCCHDMGQSIILDPYDIYMMTKALKKNFEKLLEKYLELNVVSGIILPNIKMNSNNRCSFLNEAGRCSIHGFRPGICRLFPLGRIYENESFAYFNQVHECEYPQKTKIKIKQWLDIPRLKTYEEYILTWHNFLKTQEGIIADNPERAKEINMRILNDFFIKPYLEEDFYDEFNARMNW